MQVPVPKNDSVHIFRYGDAPDVLLRSPPIQTDYFHLSLKYDFESSDLTSKMSEEHSRAFVYFSRPGQTMEWEVARPWQGFQVILSKTIFEQNPHLNFRFFSYSQHEALFLTPEEQRNLTHIYQQLFDAYYDDPEAIEIWIAYCYLILSYVQRFYQRQFESRKPIYHKLVESFQEELNRYYAATREVELSMPTVQYFAERLFVSPNYLSDVLKHYTGKSAIDLIHDHIIQEAKAKLKTSSSTVAQISHELGFDYPGYFTRLFRKKTSMTPSQYRSA